MRFYLFFFGTFFLFSCQSEQNKFTQPAINGKDTIHYSVSGEGDTALVFVHGWCINGDYWSLQVPAFKDRFKVVTLDLGGHGSSTSHRNSWTIENYGNDVRSVINVLELNKIILIGHSMGGEIILNVASQMPERVLGFIGIDNFKDTVTVYSTVQEEQIHFFLDTLRHQYRAISEEYVRTVLFPPDYSDTASVNRVLKDIQNADSIMAVETLESLMTFSTEEDALLSRLSIPVHLVVSEGPMDKDGLEYFCKKGLYINTVPGTGHYPMIEKPDYFNTQLSRTLDQIAAGK